MRIFAQAPGRIIRRGNAKSLAASELRTLCNPPSPLKKKHLFLGAEGLSCYFLAQEAWRRVGKGWRSLTAGCPVSVSERLSPSSHHLSPEHKWRAEVKLSSKVRIKRGKNKKKKKQPSSQHCQRHGKVRNSQGKAIQRASHGRTRYHGAGLNSSPSGSEMRTNC